MCALYGVSRSGYYSWKDRKPSKRAVENEALTARIVEIYQHSKQTYGSPRIAAQLRDEGFRASRPRVSRLMQLAGLKGLQRRRFRPKTTDSNHDYLPSPNLLNRDFATGCINAAWVSDLTYVHTDEGWLYLTTIMDLGDRQILGWVATDDMLAETTVVAAWKKAVRKRKPSPNLIFHSDRGAQFCSVAFRKTLRAHDQIRQSMSAKGDCWDNAAAESFFATIKKECLNNQKFETRQQARSVIFEYIETWYNQQRKHSALDYVSPVEYENKILNLKPAA